MSGNDISDPDRLPRMLNRPEVEPDEICWWAVTVGALTYASKGRGSTEALQYVAESLGTTADDMIVVPTIVYPFDETVQTELTEKFDENTCARLVPGTIDPWPKSSVA